MQILNKKVLVVKTRILKNFKIRCAKEGWYTWVLIFLDNTYYDICWTCDIIRSGRMHCDINTALQFKAFDSFWTSFYTRKIVHKISNRTSSWNDYCFNQNLCDISIHPNWRLMQSNILKVSMQCLIHGKVYSRLLFIYSN